MQFFEYVSIGIDVGASLSIIGAAWFYIRKMSELKKEEILKSSIAQGFDILIAARDNAITEHQKLKTIEVPDLPKSSDDLKKINSFSVSFWEICETLKKIASDIRIFSPRFNVKDGTRICDDVIGTIETAYDTWREKLNENCLDLKSVNQVKLSAFELTAMSELAIARAAMSKDDYEEFKKLRESENQAYRDSFEGFI